MKKIGILLLVLVLSLGAMGASYALWSDVLFLEGTVDTGDIGIEWSQGEPYDEGDDKFVSTYGCSIDGDTLHLWIDNAYPCVSYFFPLDIHGTGSIPVHTLMTITGGTLDPAWVTIPDLTGLQVHASQIYPFEIVIHLDNTALQGHHYDLFVQLDYWQYNEAGP